jgi:hypothetical protein
VQGAVAELQIVVADEIFDAFDLERHANGNAEGADGQKFDDALDAERTTRADAFERRQADHLRAIKKEMPRAAFAGVHHELRDGLAEQFADGLADHFVRHVKSVDVNHLALVATRFGQCSLALRSFDMFDGRNHSPLIYLRRGALSK